ncbi:zinc metalloprotease [Ascidiimonas sp. W6]|uniref:zinc metalloprotease n=1 Tax=Ascidiimonas meishanensis TaxID=3128903 RepID=UPI0030EF4499
MKRIFLTMAVVATILTSCSEEAKTENNNTIQAMELDESVKNSFSRSCESMGVLDKQLAENPMLAIKMAEIEKHGYEYAQRVAAKKGGNGNGNGGGGGGGEDPTPDNLGTINIPVVVHVIYSNANENISDAQINSQIDVLNEDFSKTNSDVNQVPAEFADVASDVDVQFSLAQVIRVSSTRTSWGTNDAMKSSNNGGSDAVDTSKFLNIWVCNIGGGILGYAQFPGGNSATDGVVVGPQFFGSQGFLAAPFDKGRTTTHEVGHWLNLRHIWGDGRCRQDDFVADTPSSDRPNYGCPSYPTEHCRTNDMTMNYMDYVDDACMYMFSEGQKSRMRALFTTGGVRESFLTP